MAEPRAMDLVDEIGRVAGVGAWELDVATGTCLWSGAAARILEQPAPRGGLEALLALHAGERDGGHPLRDAIASGHAFDLDLDLCLPSGRRACVRTTGHAVDGGVVRGVMHDVTDLRAAQQAGRHGEELVQMFVQRALRENELQLRAVLDTVPLGLALVARGRGQILSANARCAELFGYPAAELLGMQLFDLTHPEDRVRTISNADDARVSGRTRSLDKRYVRRDGSVMWAHVRITPVVDADGRGGGGALHAVVTIEDVTERREAEGLRIAERDRADAALRASEARLRTALDGMPIPIGLAEASGRVVLYNAEFTARFGYVREEIPNVRDWIERAYPDPGLRAAIEARWSEDLGGGGVRADGSPRQARALPVVCKDGSQCHVEIVARQIDGLILAVFHDVTATVAATAALADAEERQRLAIETAELATWRIDLVAGRAELDARARALFGVDRAVISIAELFSRIHPDDAVDGPSIERVVGVGGLRTTHRIVLESGEQRWISSTVKLHHAGDGAARQPVLATVIGHDITVERRAEDALRASEERYRTLVDSLEDVIFALDSAGIVTFVNRAVGAYGYRPEDCLGRSFLDFVHPADRGVAVEANRRRLAGELLGVVEYRVQDAAGKTRHVRVTLRASGGGALAGVLVDLTAMRATEDQLRAAQRMEAVGRLAGGIAHDFNNLLTVIMSYTELARESLRDEDPLCDDLDEIQAATKRAAGLTRQLLAFSRRQVLQPEAVDLDELVGALGKMLHRLIGEDIELQLHHAGDKAVAVVDRGQLEQVVMNLVVNARDAMPHGGRISIETAVVALDADAAMDIDVPPGPYVRLAVADSGIGMDGETQARIFEPFFTTKEVGKGTGLGLSTVYGIVKQSRGGISVTSAPGAGSTFSVFLPVDSDPTVPIVELRRVRPMRGQETILVVEDEAALRAVVVRVLSAAGYRVLVAATPSEALRLAAEHTDAIRVIFTDVVMPEMNGRELAARLGPLCPLARILYTSGYTDDALVQSGVLGQEFLPKPFEPATLSARIRALLDAA